LRLKDEFGPDEIVVVNISGRSDKDCMEGAEILARQRT
jgi:tryptophan synthase beta subunit